MPTKLNKAGKQQDYIPRGNGDVSGEYANEGGGNKNFATFKKPDDAPQSFATVNKLRTGKPSMPKEKVKSASAAAPQNLKEWEKEVHEKKLNQPPFNPMKMTSKEAPISRIDETSINKTMTNKSFEGYKDLQEVVNKAANLIKSYEGNIDATSEMLEGLAAANGGVMVGLEYRLKTLNSLTRKIYTEVSEQRAKGNKNYSYDDAVNDMKDVGRFTMVFDENNFVDGVNKTLDHLESQGYKITKFKNTFVEGATYKGLNCNFVDKNGVKYELQFHIPSSMKLKEGIEVDVGKRSAYVNKDLYTSHDIYETTRLIDKEINDGTATLQRIKLKKDLDKMAMAQWSKVPNINIERQLK